MNCEVFKEYTICNIPAKHLVLLLIFPCISHASFDPALYGPLSLLCCSTTDSDSESVLDAGECCDLRTVSFVCPMLRFVTSKFCFQLRKKDFGCES